MRRLWLAVALLAGLAAGLAPGPAAADRLIISLSNHRVLISSNFTGAELVLFGSVENDSASGRHGYDIVVSVLGPRQSMVARRKARVAGIWVNTDARTFVDPPSYLAVLANRAPDMIAAPDILRRLQVGLGQFLLPQEIGNDLADVTSDDPYRIAFLRLKIAQKLYREETNGVTFLTPSLFRASIPLPADVPIGSYEVDVKLFGDGAMLARESTAFETVKVGFEQFVANAAREHGFLYGLVTAGMALMTGWLASIVFRKD